MDFADAPERLAEDPRIRDAALVAYRFKQDPLVMLDGYAAALRVERDTPHLAMNVRIAAAMVIDREEAAAEARAKAKANG